MAPPGQVKPGTPAAVCTDLSPVDLKPLKELLNEIPLEKLPTSAKLDPKVAIFYQNADFFVNMLDKEFGNGDGILQSEEIEKYKEKKSFKNTDTCKLLNAARRYAVNAPQRKKEFAALVPPPIDLTPLRALPYLDQFLKIEVSDYKNLDPNLVRTYRSNIEKSTKLHPQQRKLLLKNEGALIRYIKQDLLLKELRQKIEKSTEMPKELKELLLKDEVVFGNYFNARDLQRYDLDKNGQGTFEEVDQVLKKKGFPADHPFFNAPDTLSRAQKMIPSLALLGFQLRRILNLKDEPTLINLPQFVTLFQTTPEIGNDPILKDFMPVVFNDNKKGPLELKPEMKGVTALTLEQFKSNPAVQKLKKENALPGGSEEAFFKKVQEKLREKFIELTSQPIDLTHFKALPYLDEILKLELPDLPDPKNPKFKEAFQEVLKVIAPKIETAEIPQKLKEVLLQNLDSLVSYDTAKKLMRKDSDKDHQLTLQEIGQEFEKKGIPAYDPESNAPNELLRSRALTSGIVSLGLQLRQGLKLKEDPTLLDLDWIYNLGALQNRKFDNEEESRQIKFLSEKVVKALGNKDITFKVLFQILFKTNEKGELVKSKEGKYELVPGNSRLLTLEGFKKNPLVQKMKKEKTLPGGSEEVFFASIKDSLALLRSPAYLWSKEIKEKFENLGPEGIRFISQLQGLNKDQNNTVYVLEKLEETNELKYAQERIDHPNDWVRAVPSVVTYPVFFFVSDNKNRLERNWGRYFNEERPLNNKNKRQAAIEALRKTLKEKGFTKIKQALDHLEENGESDTVKILKEECYLPRWMKISNIENRVERDKETRKAAQEFNVGSYKSGWDFQILPSYRHVSQVGAEKGSKIFTWKSPELPLALSLNNILYNDRIISDDVRNSRLLVNKGGARWLLDQLDKATRESVEMMTCEMMIGYAEKSDYEKIAYLGYIFDSSNKITRIDVRKVTELLDKVPIPPEERKILVDYLKAGKANEKFEPFEKIHKIDIEQIQKNLDKAPLSLEDQQFLLGSLEILKIKRHTDWIQRADLNNAEALLAKSPLTAVPKEHQTIAYLKALKAVKVDMQKATNILDQVPDNIDEYRKAVIDNLKAIQVGIKKSEDLLPKASSTVTAKTRQTFIAHLKAAQLDIKKGEDRAKSLSGPSLAIKENMDRRAVIDYLKAAWANISKAEALIEVQGREILLSYLEAAKVMANNLQVIEEINQLRFMNELKKLATMDLAKQVGELEKLVRDAKDKNPEIANKVGEIANLVKDQNPEISKKAGELAKSTKSDHPEIAKLATEIEKLTRDKHLEIAEEAEKLAQLAKEKHPEVAEKAIEYAKEVKNRRPESVQTIWGFATLIKEKHSTLAKQAGKLEKLAKDRTLEIEEKAAKLAKLAKDKGSEIATKAKSIATLADKNSLISKKAASLENFAANKDPEIAKQAGEVATLAKNYNPEVAQRAQMQLDGINQVYLKAMVGVYKINELEQELNSLQKTNLSKIVYSKDGFYRARDLGWWPNFANGELYPKSHMIPEKDDLKELKLKYLNGEPVKDEAKDANKLKKIQPIPLSLSALLQESKLDDDQIGRLNELYKKRTPTKDEWNEIKKLINGSQLSANNKNLLMLLKWNGIDAIFQEAQLQPNEARAREIYEMENPPEAERLEFEKLIDGSKLSDKNKKTLKDTFKARTATQVTFAAEDENLAILGNPPIDHKTGKPDPLRVGSINNGLRVATQHWVIAPAAATFPVWAPAALGGIPIKILNWIGPRGIKGAINPWISAVAGVIFFNAGSLLRETSLPRGSWEYAKAAWTTPYATWSSFSGSEWATDLAGLYLSFELGALQMRAGFGAAGLMGQFKPFRSAIAFTGAKAGQWRWLKLKDGNRFVQWSHGFRERMAFESAIRTAREVGHPARVWYSDVAGGAGRAEFEWAKNMHQSLMKEIKTRKDQIDQLREAIEGAKINTVGTEVSAVARQIEGYQALIAAQEAQIAILTQRATVYAEVGTVSGAPILATEALKQAHQLSTGTVAGAEIGILKIAGEDAAILMKAGEYAKAEKVMLQAGKDVKKLFNKEDGMHWAAKGIYRMVGRKYRGKVANQGIKEGAALLRKSEIDKKAAELMKGGKTVEEATEIAGYAAGDRIKNALKEAAELGRKPVPLTPEAGAAPIGGWTAFKKTIGVRGPDTVEEFLGKAMAQIQHLGGQVPNQLVLNNNHLVNKVLTSKLLMTGMGAYFNYFGYFNNPVPALDTYDRNFQLNLRLLNQHSCLGVNECKIK
jgi:hypothetical protein